MRTGSLRPWRFAVLLPALLAACTRDESGSATAGWNDGPFTPMRTWQLSPAYASDWSRPIGEQHFAPEFGLADAGDVSWLPIESAPDGAVDLRRFEPQAAQGTIYARTRIEGPRRIELAIESDDGFELFLDRESRACKQEIRALGGGVDRIRLELPPGIHELLLKVMNAGGTWGFRVGTR